MGLLVIGRDGACKNPAARDTAGRGWRS